MGGLGSPAGPHGGSGVVQFTSLAQLDAAYGRRVTKEVNGRKLTVLAHGGQLFALDAACFHLGGPLGAEGDIEELGSRTCIVCPWHRRKIDLRTGQQVDTDLQGAVCTSHDAKQRVYPTRVDADGFVWVDCSSADGPGVQSGAYSSCLPQSSGLGGGRPGFGLAQQLGLAGAPPAAPPQTPAVWGERRPTVSPPGSGSVLPQLNLNQGLMPFRAQKASARNASARMAVLRKMAAVKEAECSAMES